MRQTSWRVSFGCLACTLLAVSCSKPIAQDPVTSEPADGPGPRSVDVVALEHEETSDEPVDAAVETNLRFEIAPSTGLGFRHVGGRSKDKLMPEIMGGGLLVADFNRDAAPDILFVSSGRVGESRQGESAAHLVVINQGNGHFDDRTDAWGIKNAGYGMGGAVGDFDNDGWPDVYLTTFDGNDRLLRNTGSAFVDVTDQAGLGGVPGWSTSAGFFDMDQDGDLDLYVAKYVAYAPKTVIPCYFQGFQLYCTPVMFEALPDRLFRNEGDGTFTDVSRSAGIPSHGKGLALTIGDIDGDGDSDIYVANDTTANFLLINDGKGKFEEKGGLFGVGYSSFGNEESGMGADLSDVNRDGLLDIACTNFQGETTSVYIQQPQGYFIERSDGLGVGKTARLRLSFGVDFFDADNDGLEDMLVANGHISVDVNLYATGVEFGQRNTLYQNRDGKLVDVTQAAGSAFQSKKPSRGLATGDLDNDGDLDFVVVNNDTDAEIGLNVSKDVGNFVSLWLEGETGNRSAIGTVVTASIGERRITRQVLGASSYLSFCDPRIHLGLGTADQIDELVIRWSGGSQQVVSDLAGGAHYYLKEGRDPVVVRPGERVIRPE
jgi:hypothetical protein